MVTKLAEKLRDKKLLSTTLILLTLIIGILLGTLVSSGVKAARQSVASDATPLTIPRAEKINTNSFAQIAKRLKPAVVNINTESVVKATPQTRRRRGGGNEDEDPRDLFRRFFGPFEPGTEGPDNDQRVRSLGSGVIVDPKGYVLTNHHVIENAERIRVKIGRAHV